MAPVAPTKTDRKLEDKMLAAAGDPQRSNVIAKARTFKRSWLELAEALTGVLERGSWEGWGYRSFDAYCKKELQITPSTAAKLTGSFRFLKTSAPTIIERSHATPEAPVPDVKTVDFVQRAEERGAADEDTMAEIRRVAFDEGARAPMLARRFKSVAFPVSDADAQSKLLSQLGSTSRKLAALIAEPNLPVPHDIAAQVEQAIGKLLESIEDKLA
ncbi:MAG: hypothetical protein GY811_20590 [Myxococcales bacterium]|nr:hypothetical protein [Myxococcales bacterium]